MLRWLYARRAPNAGLHIDFGPRSCACTTSGTRWAARPPTRRRRDVAALACAPRLGDVDRRAPLPTPAVAVPFRTLSSVADVTAGSADLISPRSSSHVGFPHDSVADLEPRLSQAMAWTASHVPEPTSARRCARRPTPTGWPR